jgi:hypothetical protein
MATTTPNYGWSVPTSTDLVKDGATAIETLGDSADATVKALNPETTLGDIAYRSATANTNTRLAIGSTGQVLTVAGGVPTWAASAGGGKILQVVTATYSTQTTSTTNTYVDTGLSASITPASTSSRILVLVTQPLNTEKATIETYADIQILRGATVIYGPTSTYSTSGMQLGSGSYTQLLSYTSYSYVDSPSTTSSTTYKTQFRSFNSGTAQVQKNSSVSTITLLEIGA